jgi:hypothetical protein
MEHRPLDLPEAVHAIHQALGVLHGDAAEEVAWLRTWRAGPVFGGKAPLDLVTDGTTVGLIAVLNCLRAAQRGHSTGPEPLDRAFRPHGAAEIHLG